MPLQFGGVAPLVDFSDQPTFGTEAQWVLGGQAMLWPGDTGFNGLVNYVGTGNDRDLLLQVIGGVVPTNSITGYLREDVNMDHVVRYTGADNDRDVILQVIGGSVPTTVRSAQMP